MPHVSEQVSRGHADARFPGWLKDEESRKTGRSICFRGAGVRFPRPSKETTIASLTLRMFHRCLRGNKFAESRRHSRSLFGLDREQKCREPRVLAVLISQQHLLGESCFGELARESFHFWARRKNAPLLEA